MQTCKPFKRNIKTGQIVTVVNNIKPMRVLKYDDKLSEETGKHIVCVTWQEKKTYQIARFNEDDLIPFSQA
jgi:hypothetical protein